MKKFIILSLFALLNFCNLSNAQTVSLSNQTALPCENISFPITASGFTSTVGAVTLYIAIDTNVIKCTGHTPGTLSFPAYAINFQGSPISIAWSYPAGLAINGTMLTLHFKNKGGNALLDFTSGCEIAYAVPPDPIPVTYIDGSIAPKPTTTYYVDAAVGASGNGLSWATALKKISEATNKPLAPGDKVLIKPASYTDTVVIKTSGTEIVPLTFGVTVSDTNKITFPSSADLSCVDIADYPGKFYAYLGRSWKGNNGVYKIIQVNKTLKYVIVEGAEFTSEAGVASDSSYLQASIGFPVVYEKSSNNPLAERIILSSTGISGERAALHIGKPTSSGDFDVNAANYNIIDGIDITGADQVGVRIQNSKFNVYKNSRIYELDSIGVMISGNTAKPANNNYILNNSIYNTKLKAIKIGIQNQTSANNRANLNHIKGNEIYSSGAGGNINFVNAVDISRYTGYTVMENNTVKNFKLKNINRGAIEIKNDVRKVLAYSNFIKNIGRVNASNTHSIFYLQTNGNNNKFFDNVLVDSAAVDNNVYAFWVNVSTGGYTSGLIGYNTVYKVDNGFKLESGGSNVDFLIKNNIMNLDQTAPDHFTISGTGLYTVSYNCYSTSPIGYPGETGRLVVADPLFLLPGSYHSPYGFSLQSSSLCLNSGNPISAIDIDFGRMPRSITNPSRGAFEEVISSASWTGEINNNWHDYRNWDIKLVPLSSLDVIIPDRANDPVISGGNVTVKSLQLDPAARIRLNSPRILMLTD
jgi:hypothetical protein